MTNIKYALVLLSGLLWVTMSVGCSVRTTETIAESIIILPTENGPEFVAAEAKRVVLTGTPDTTASKTSFLPVEADEIETVGQSKNDDVIVAPWRTPIAQLDFSIQYEKDIDREIAGDTDGAFAAISLPEPGDGASVGDVPEVVVMPPPSLMLHSWHSRESFFPPLLEALLEAGYQPTTYQIWIDSVLTGQPIPNPIIITVDDLTMEQGNGAFSYHKRIKDWADDYGVKVVFAINTEPNGIPQDENRWDEVASWAAKGFELATHSSTHPIMNDPFSGPNTYLTQADYEYEIVGSALFIRDKLLARGVDYHVTTFVTPYGHGYSYNASEPYIHAGIVDACQKAGINLVIGISLGHEPLLKSGFRDGIVQYIGRLSPQTIVFSDGARELDVSKTIWAIHDWAKRHRGLR